MWTEALYNLSFHRDVCCFSSAFKKFCVSLDISIFFILMRVKNCSCSKAITPTRSPSGSKMDLCWVTATWRIRAKLEKQKIHVHYQTALLSLTPHKKKRAFPLEFTVSSTQLAQNKEEEGTGDVQNPSGLWLPPSLWCHIMKSSAPFPYFYATSHSAETSENLVPSD